MAKDEIDRDAQKVADAIMGGKANAAEALDRIADGLRQLGSAVAPSDAMSLAEAAARISGSLDNVADALNYVATAIARK